MFDRILLGPRRLARRRGRDRASPTALARRSGATVHVLHVNERLVGGNGLTLRSKQEATDLVTAAVRQLADAGVRAGRVGARARRTGAVPARIVAVAQERSADAIVLGSNRNRRLARLFSARVRERTTRLHGAARADRPLPAPGHLPRRRARPGERVGPGPRRPPAIGIRPRGACAKRHPCPKTGTFSPTAPTSGAGHHREVVMYVDLLTQALGNI